MEYKIRYLLIFFGLLNCTFLSNTMELEEEVTTSIPTQIPLIHNPSLANQENDYIKITRSGALPNHPVQVLFRLPSVPFAIISRNKRNDEVHGEVINSTDYPLTIRYTYLSDQGEDYPIFLEFKTKEENRKLSNLIPTNSTELMEIDLTKAPLIQNPRPIFTPWLLLYAKKQLDSSPKDATENTVLRAQYNLLSPTESYNEYSLKVEKENDQLFLIQNNKPKEEANKDTKNLFATTIENLIIILNRIRIINQITGDEIELIIDANQYTNAQTDDTEEAGEKIIFIEDNEEGTEEQQMLTRPGLRPVLSADELEYSPNIYPRKETGTPWYMRNEE